MGLIQEFKDFINKGNVMDLAVGVIIGGAFGKIVDSLVKDVVTPIIGKVVGQPDFSAIKVADSIMIGKFINEVVSFVIIAFAVFMMIKGLNAMKKPAPEAPAAPAGPTEVELLMEIRDALKK